MPLQPVISARGMEMATLKPPAFLDVYFEGLGNLYSKSNPSGSINLCMAENQLSKEMVRAKLAEDAKSSVDMISMGYQDFWGRPELRQAFSDFMERKLGGKVGADNLAIINGAGSAVMLTTFALCDAGDAVLLPAPLYYGFGRDIEGLAGAKIVPLEELTSKCLASTYKTQTEAGSRPKVLLLTNPGNPTGAILHEDVIRGAVEWAQANGVHVVMDEMYAVSVFRSSPFKFKSCLEIFDKLPTNVHLVWGLSKDFCGSGLRCVGIHSRDENFMDAISKYTYFFQVGGPLQLQVASMLNDKPWVDRYIAKMNNDLKMSCEFAESVLRENDIPFLAPQAAFFLWCDFSKWSNMAGGEVPFLAYLSKLPGGGVLLTAGEGCSNPVSGWFRLCFSSSTVEELTIGMNRLVKAVKAIDDGTAKIPSSAAKL